MARKEQKLIFTITKTETGKMLVNMSFYPKLVNKEQFEQLTMERKEMQCMAGDIGKFVMQKLAELHKDRQGKSDENTAANPTGT